MGEVAHDNDSALFFKFWGVLAILCRLDACTNFYAQYVKRRLLAQGCVFWPHSPPKFDFWEFLTELENFWLEIGLKRCGFWKRMSLILEATVLELGC